MAGPLLFCDLISNLITYAHAHGFAPPVIMAPGLLDNGKHGGSVGGNGLAVSQVDYD
jgi:hypothetical protein